MTDQNNIGESFIEPISERLGRIDRGLSGLAKVVGLELVDIELADNLDDETRHSLAVLGGQLLAINQLSGRLIQDIAQTLGEDIVTNQVSELPLGRILATSTPKSSNGQSPNGVNKTTRRESSTPRETKQSSDSPHDIGVDKGDNQELLYLKLLDPSYFPEVEIRVGNPIPVTIVSDNQLMINNRKLTLNDTQLYLFNSLMTLRDGPRSASEIKGAHFNATSANAFSAAINPLMKLLNSAAGIELIKKDGIKALTRYYVNPNLAITDNREHEVANAENNGDVVKKK